MTAGRGAPDLAAVLDWMRRDGRRYMRMRDFSDALCERVVATLHPQIAAAAYIWRRDGGTAREAATREDKQRPDIRDSPLARVTDHREILRRRLDDPAERHDYPIFERLHAEGMTDYVAVPVTFSDDTCHPLSLATDDPDGFLDGDVAALVEIAEMLGAIVELQSARRIARQLMDTYVGRRTGARVLAGQIARGSYETIHAVIWHADLRGFTALTDTLPRGDVMELLEDWFDIVGAALAVEGGEILKFVGDAARPSSR